MSDEHIQQDHNAEVGYEPQDLSSKSIFAFLAALAVMTVIFVFMLRGLYMLMDRYEQEHQTPPSPLVTDVPKDTRHVPADARTKFPEPRLEVDERTQLNDFLIQQEDQLATYGYVDQQAGTVRIPIEQAMKLVAQRGLPVLPAGGTVPAQSKVSAAKPALAAANTAAPKAKQ
jgi:hypothetical protein